jgi:hypothetical protein
MPTCCAIHANMLRNSLRGTSITVSYALQSVYSSVYYILLRFAAQQPIESQSSCSYVCDLGNSGYATCFHACQCSSHVYEVSVKPMLLQLWQHLHFTDTSHMRVLNCRLAEQEH